LFTIETKDSCKTLNVTLHASVPANPGVGALPY
jgi:hypothetical protein